MRAGRRWMIAGALVAAALVAGAATAAAQAAGGMFGSQSGFSVENVISELSEFLPEGTSTFGAQRFGGPGGTGAATGGQAGGQTGQAGGQQQNRQAGQGGDSAFAAAMRDFPTFKRDPKLYLTAKQVDAIVPVLKDLQANPFPTPGKAKQVQAALDAALTKQQKDAWASYVKERDKAIEKLRQQFASQQGAAGGQTGQAGGQQQNRQAGQGGSGGTAGQNGQRAQRDPAEMRKQMLASFLDALAQYRKGLK